MNTIIIDGLTKKYKDTVAVDRFELTIARGELFSLLGVNGAGKTTTIKMLSCVTAPTAGDAFICGNSILHAPLDVKSTIAVSPQQTAVAPGLTVLENLELICGVYGFPRQKRRAKTEEILCRLDLKQVANKKAGKLSGGWQRRLSIAMALISEPQILFLDEPTLGLDVLARSDLWDLIRELKGFVTIVLTTHYMEEAEALSDRVGIMSRGKLLCCDTVENIKARTNADSLEQAFVRIVKEAEK